VLGVAVELCALPEVLELPEEMAMTYAPAATAMIAITMMATAVVPMPL